MALFAHYIKFIDSIDIPSYLIKVLNLAKSKSKMIFIVNVILFK